MLEVIDLFQKAINLYMFYENIISLNYFIINKKVYSFFIMKQLNYYNKIFICK